jgi:hypothetical protein
MSHESLRQEVENVVSWYLASRLRRSDVQVAVTFHPGSELAWHDEGFVALLFNADALAALPQSARRAVVRRELARLLYRTLSSGWTNRCLAPAGARLRHARPVLPTGIVFPVRHSVGPHRT